MFSYTHELNEENPMTIVVSAKGAKPVVRHVTRHLLCRVCDNRLSKYGENIVLRNMWNGKRFRLLDRLNVAIPIESGGAGYPGTAIGINTEPFAYFALSVIWRSSVCEWTTSKTDRHRIDIGDSQEPIRSYLAGDSPYPANVSVMVTVCEDRFSRIFHLPTDARFPNLAIKAFVLNALGINFLVFLRPFSPEQICCVRSPRKVLFKRDCSQKIIEAYRNLIGC
jgi:hypothetical protein